MLDWLMLRIIEKCVSKPCFISWKDFHKYLVVLHEIKPVLTLDKPIYVGFSVLDLSKLLMYYLNYNYIQRKYDAELSSYLQTQVV